MGKEFSGDCIVCAVYAQSAEKVMCVRSDL